MAELSRERSRLQRSLALSETLPAARCRRVRLKSAPVASTGHRNPVFWSQWFRPRGAVFIVVPEEKWLPAAVLSHDLSATAAATKTAPAKRGAGGGWPRPRLRRSSGRSSGRLAGPPPGRQLEDQRWKQRVSKCPEEPKVREGSKGRPTYLGAVCWTGCEPRLQHRLQPRPCLLWPLLPLESLKEEEKRKLSITGHVLRQRGAGPSVVVTLLLLQPENSPSAATTSTLSLRQSFPWWCSGLATGQRRNKTKHRY